MLLARYLFQEIHQEDFDTFVRDNELLDSEFKIYDIGEVSEMCRKAKEEGGDL